MLGPLPPLDALTSTKSTGGVGEREGSNGLMLEGSNGPMLDIVGDGTHMVLLWQT